MLKRTLYFVLTILMLAMGFAIWYSAWYRRVRLSDTIPEVDNSREARVLSAFYGLESLPLVGTLLYPKAYGKDGMPVVFSQEIDPTTLNPDDFEVTTKNGATHKVEFVTLKPANEAYELRTVLLIGEFGDHPENPPVSVKIANDLLSRSGQNYRGQQVNVIPLPDGPTISYAEYFSFENNYPYEKTGAGCDCPRDNTALVVRTVWSGGVKAINGDDPGDNELDSFQVLMIQGNDTVQVTPFQIADLSDNDNNLDLCLKEKGIPISVEAKAGILIDPRADINPQTKSQVISRW